MNTDNINELLPLLTKRIDKYTSKESSSIPYVKAQQLMDSILYCIEQMNPQSTSISSNHTMEECFLIGMEKVKELVNITKLLYAKVQQDFISYHNSCYYDTIIIGMPAFFTHYDFQFDARNSILTLDYPLLYEVIEQEGVAKIYEYLCRIQLEQLFLAKFSPTMIETLLDGYDLNHSELIFNITALVLTNALGCLLLNRSATPLYVNTPECEHLTSIGVANTRDQLKLLLIETLKKLIRTDYTNNQHLLNYLLHHIDGMATSFKLCASNNCMERLFLKRRNSNCSNATAFEDGIPMDDLALRQLIEEMKNLRYLSDKLILLKEHIKSLSDLKEVFRECFYSGEYTVVFELLNQSEIIHLKGEITWKINFDEELYNWEIELLIFSQLLL